MEELYVSHVKREKTFSLVAAICQCVLLIYYFTYFILQLKDLDNDSPYIVVTILILIELLYAIATGIVVVISLFKRKRSDIYLIAQGGVYIFGLVVKIVQRFFIENDKAIISVTGLIFLVYLILYKVLKAPKYRSLLSKLCFVPAIVSFVFWIFKLPSLAWGRVGSIAQIILQDIFIGLIDITYMLFLCMFLSPYTQILRRDVQPAEEKSGQDTSVENAENKEETKQDTDDKM